MTTPAVPLWAQDVDVDDGANDALLDDLFTFLDGEDPATDGTSLDSHSDGGSVSSPIKSSGRSVDTSSAPPSKRPRPPRRIKRTLDELRLEARQLTDTLERLRDVVTSTPSSHLIEIALTERLKRRRAEHEREQLRDAVYAQTQFLKGLHSVFSSPPSFATGLNLCRHLHNYTRLPRDRAVRRSEYAALSEESRLQRAMEILCRETQSLVCNQRGGCCCKKPLLSSTVAEPFAQAEVINDEHGFGVTSMSVYALETRDLSVVARGACVAVRDALARCTSYQLMDLRGQIVDPEAASSSATNMLYRVTGVRQKSLEGDNVEFSIEARMLTLYKQTDDYAVVLWDYVDDDELYPTTDADITRQAIGACLIRHEICDDGVERTVCRIIRTRLYRFHACAESEKLRRYQEELTTGSSGNELLFRGLLLDAIAKEQAAYIRVTDAAQTDIC